jgi:hypothetical protein
MGFFQFTRWLYVSQGSPFMFLIQADWERFFMVLVDQLDCILDQYGRKPEFSDNLSLQSSIFNKITRRRIEAL